MATEQPTKEQWAEIAQRLDCIGEVVALDCDGYLVVLRLSRIAKMELAISVSVDGVFKGAWLHADRTGERAVLDADREIGRRFLQPGLLSVYAAKDKPVIRRAFGKKEAERRITIRKPVWKSANSLRRHLVKHNDRIRLLSLEEAIQRLEALKAAREETA